MKKDTPSFSIEGSRVYIFRWMKGHGMALPPFGILVGPDFHQNLLQHEFGHILQYREKGMWRFYTEVGLPSFINMILLKLEKLFFRQNRFIPPHSRISAEIEAQNLADQYFTSKV